MEIAPGIAHGAEKLANKVMRDVEIFDVPSKS